MRDVLFMFKAAKLIEAILRAQNEKGKTQESLLSDEEMLEDVLFPGNSFSSEDVS